MSRHKRAVCEDRLTIDVRTLRREGLLRPGREFSFSVRVGGEQLGRIDISTQADAVLLTYERHPPRTSASTRRSQRVPIQWTQCKFGGRRPWFECTSVSGGYGCGRRVAKLYLGGGALFACRLCHGLGYTSQSESAANRALAKARKLRTRLGGGPSLLEPFPGKPPRMHWTTYYRMLGQAMTAQERSIALELAWLRRHPLLSEEPVAEL